uniref:GLOBIN domain-containing protein n=1 Tax=Panagrellus redivivus TaxID=6233 RepID=A0A7E4W3W0_PANRE
MKHNCDGYVSRKDPDHRASIATTTPSSETLALLASKMADKPVQHATSVDSGVVDNVTFHEEYEREQVAIELARLTTADRDILKEVYVQLAGDGMRCGLNIMLSLFSEHPHYKNIWPQFRPIPDSSLMNAPELRKHVKVYLHGLKNIIDNLDDEERIFNALRKIAQAHVKWNVYRHHVINMLGPVLDTIKMCTGSLTPEKERAWTILYEVIANLIEVFRTSEKNRVNKATIQRNGY